MCVSFYLYVCMCVFVAGRRCSNIEEAVECHRDIGSKQSVGVHWGTFLLTGEPIMEPPDRVRKALIKHNLNADAFTTLQHGETRTYPLVDTSQL
eukprot:m.100115 g.100115  ORF g.100115 m.100115 type:complete len:94 (-) comp16775_c1_seq6:129-410(-)